MSDDRPFASRYALAFIFMTMLLDTIGLGLIIPVAPKIIAELLGHPTTTAAAMSQASWWGGWLQFVFAGMQFLCAPLIGNLSDRFGRKPVLIASLLALGVDYTITGLAPTIWWLFVGRLLTGIAGASYTTVNAYIADVSPPEKRAANFGLTGAAFSLGFILGPVLGGLLGEIGTRLPFFVAALLSLLNALFGMFVLKESLAPENRRKFEFWRANPVGALAVLSRFPNILVMCAVIVLMRLAHDSNPVIYTYYVYAKFHWTPSMVSYALVWVGALMFVVYGVLTRVVIPRIGEVASVYIGLACGAIGFAGYAFSSRDLGDVRLDGAVRADGLRHAGAERDHVERRGAARAGRAARRARLHRQPHLRRGAAAAHQPVRVFHGSERAGLFPGRGVPGGEHEPRHRRAGVHAHACGLTGARAGAVRFGSRCQWRLLRSRSSSSLIRSFSFFRAATRISSQSGLAISALIDSSSCLCFSESS